MNDPRDPHVLGPGQAPTPFTADEIRHGCPVGRALRLLVEVQGEAPLYRVNRFVACDETGATVERRWMALDGTPIGEPELDRTTWLELQAHASFPADHTDIRPETIETAVGALDCMRYTVTDGSTVQTFWFATARPGMPIRFMTEEAGQIVTTVSVVDDTTS